MSAAPQDVTAIVPTYNRARYLGECLDALLAQTTPPRQILVVDDGSTDDTAAIVAGYGARIEYLRKENGGKSSALNLALTRASGAAIWIFDDDDVAEPTALASLCAALDGAPEAGFAFGDYDNFADTPDGRRSIPAPPPPFDPDDLHCALLERCFIFQPALLVRRACYDAVGPFDTAFVRAQDYEMILRLSRHAAGVHIPRILFHQRQHAEIRGTAAHAIDGAEIWERQKKFDAVVLEGAHRTNSLADYLPRTRQATILGPREQIDALLRRYVVMARKRLWPLAVADLAQATDLARAYGIGDVPPAETAMLRRVFDEFGYARDGLDADNPLLRQIDALPAGPFCAAIRSALLWPLFRYTLLAAWRRDGTAFRRHAHLYRHVTDGRTFLRHAARLVRAKPARNAG